MTKEFDANICSNCGGVPLFGCVSCPKPPSRADELQEKLDDIESEVNMALQTNEPTLKEECLKRWNTLLKIRKIIHRKKKDDR